MIKIGFIIENYYPSYGGPYSVIKETFKALSKNNEFKIKVIYQNDKNGKKNIDLAKAIKDLDICHFFGGWTYFYIKTSLLAFKLGKKVIFCPFGIFEPYSMQQKKIKKKVAWFLYQESILKKANIVHCTSKAEEKNLLRINPHFKTIVLPHGIEDKFIKKITKKNPYKSKLKKALFFSRVHPKKGLDELLKAWIEIDNKNWTLDIIGPYENKNYYESLVAIAKKSNSKIRFLTSVFDYNKKKLLFEKYNFFVLPTKNETFGMSILESLSRGLPVLTNKNAPWHEIKTFNAGWFIQDNYFHLKSALKKIFKTNQRNFHLKSNNAIKLSKKYSWSAILESYILLYRQLLNK
jgi:glycosyltransferase involved in cell wall biosynthesis